MKIVEILSVFFLLSGCNLQQESMESESNTVDFLKHLQTTDQAVGVDTSKVNQIKSESTSPEKTNSQVDFKTMADQNIDFDQNSEFEDQNAFTWLYNHHQRIIIKEQNKVLKINKKMGRLHDQLERYRVDRAVAHTEEETKVYQNKIEVIEVELNRLDKWLAETIQNMDQHYYFSDLALEMAKSEKGFIDLHQDNKSYLSLEGNKGHKTDSAQELLEDQNAYSLSLWFRTVDQQENKVLMLINEETTNGFVEIGLDNSGVYVRHQVDDKVIAEGKGVLSYNQNDWHHVCIVKEENQMKLYLDATLVSTFELHINNYGLLPIYFGSFKNKERFLSGDLDEISLWSKSLQEEDISNIYNDSIPGDLSYGTQIDFLIKWWRMGDQTPMSVKGDYY